MQIKAANESVFENNNVFAVIFYQAGYSFKNC